MIIAPALLFFLVLSVLVLAIVILITVSIYEKTSLKLQKAQKDVHGLQESIQQKTVKALERVTLQAEEIIKKTNQEAANIIQQASTFSTSENAQLKSKIDELIQRNLQTYQSTTQEYLKQYKTELQEKESDAIKSFSSVSKAVETVASSEIQSFTKILEKETVEKEALVEQKIAGAYQQLEAELKTYKDKRLSEIEQKLKDQMEEIIKSVLQTHLRPEDQEVLIREAILAARKKIPSL